MALANFSEIIIAGTKVKGYSSYDTLNSKTFSASPERTISGNMVGLGVETFIVTTITLVFTLIPYSTYKTLYALLNGTVELTVTYWDVDSDTEKTGKFYLAPATKKELYVKGKIVGGSKVPAIEGIRNLTVELISTNN